MAKHVAVIGGGVIGLASAFFLRREGAEVTVFEARRVGSGASLGNSGWIAPSFAAPLPGPGITRIALKALAHRNGSFYISPRHVPRLAAWLWRFWRASGAAAHQRGLLANARFALDAEARYDRLAADGVQFEMHATGVAHAFTSRANADLAHRALAPLAALGYVLPENVLDGESLRRLEPALGGAVAAGFIVSGERAVNPASLLDGLRKQLLESGVEIRENHAVSDFEADVRSIGALRCGRERFDVDEVVLAAGVWTRALAARLGIALPIEAGKGYSFTAVAPAAVPTHCLHLFEAKVAVSPFDNGLRLAGTMELSGMSPNLNRRRVAAVAAAAEPYLKGWAAEARDEEWMGMRPMTPDGLPVIGRPGGWRNVVVATGHGMLGVMLAPATGRSVAQIILDGGASTELEVFNPDRFRRS